jgi:heme exporter protein A
MDLSLAATDLKKDFNRRTIFQDVSFSLRAGETLLISGRNGSGKSTLAKIIAEVLSPSKGEVSLMIGRSLWKGGRYPFIGFVAPYLQLYEEFSANEMLALSLALRGLPRNPDRIQELLRFVGLEGRDNDLIRTYSSGMKQRVKLAMAIVHQPPVLILDEPMANLDADGIAMVRGVMQDHLSSGCLIVATNDRTDISHYNTLVDLNAHR